MDQHLPSAFISTMRQQLGLEWEAFLKALQNSSPVSIHYNLAKDPVPFFEGDPVPWNPNGLYLRERPSFTLDPNFQAGRYYVQEAGSMFLAFVLEQLKEKKELQFALDLCAAPGGKSTLLLNHLPENALLVANEVIRSRYQILRENLAKWGRGNVISTQADSEAFLPLAGKFDLVLVDAPCSGEGLFRKTPDAVSEWSPQNVELCAARQRRILTNAHQLLNEGGFLIYSTCTYNALENDQNVAWLKAEGDLETVDLSIPDNWGVLATEHGYQFYPHRTQTEGFFIAILQKKHADRANSKSTLRYFSKSDKKTTNQLEAFLQNQEAFQVLQNPKGALFMLPQTALPMLELLSQALSRITPGVPLGQIKGKDLIPAHEFSLLAKQMDHFPAYVVDKAEALQFLRKVPMESRADTAKGWHRVSYGGFGLGWIKVLPQRINNYFPNQLRIRK